jgi:hypothetical protein
MADTQETIADIIAEKRRLAEHIRNNLSTVPVRQWEQQSEIKALEDEADRLEAALRRERGDAAKLRGALTKVKEWMEHRIASNCDKYTSLDEARNAFMAINEMPEGNRDADMRRWLCDFYSWLFATATEAEIGRPRRNCDVGTAKEQENRFYRFCLGRPSCKHCPLRDANVKCDFAWAQMPYVEKEGGTK